MASFNETMGANLKALRTERGMNQQQLADAMRERGADHWRQNTVSRVENGRQPLTVDETFQLSQILKFDVVQFVESSGDPKAEDPDDTKLDLQWSAGEEVGYVRASLEKMRKRLDQAIADLVRIEGYWKLSDGDYGSRGFTAADLDALEREEQEDQGDGD